MHSIYHFISLILELGDGVIGHLGENVQERVAQVLNFGADNVITLDLRMEVSLALVIEKNTDFAVLVKITFVTKISSIENRKRSVLIIQIEDRLI